jgi:hypothetical protein
VAWGKDFIIIRKLLNEEVSFTTDKSETILEETKYTEELCVLLRSQVDDESWYNPEAMCSCFMKSPYSTYKRGTPVDGTELRAVFDMVFLTAVTSIITHIVQQHGSFSYLLPSAQSV